MNGSENTTMNNSSLPNTEQNNIEMVEPKYEEVEIKKIARNDKNRFLF